MAIESIILFCLMLMYQYDEFLEKPGSHVAHELLHTHYTKREKY